MSGATTSRDEAHLDVVFLDAFESGRIPERPAREARSATLRWIRRQREGGEAIARHRVAGYFWAVIRRRALAGDPDLGSFRARCVADTIACDMRDAGHTQQAVVAALDRAVGARGAREWLESVA